MRRRSKLFSCDRWRSPAFRHSLDARQHPPPASHRKSQRALSNRLAKTAVDAAVGGRRAGRAGLHAAQEVVNGGHADLLAPFLVRRNPNACAAR